MRVTRTASRPPAPACPTCHSPAQVRPLVFGYPSPEMFEASERGEIVLGGCCLPEGAVPQWRCRVCGAEFA